MWFDVGIKRYTTEDLLQFQGDELWFDVGIKRYTTTGRIRKSTGVLWFDVGIKRYTTVIYAFVKAEGCGLM